MEIKTCEHCGKKFTSVMWYARYCSNKCRMAASRANRKKELDEKKSTAKG